MFYQISSREIIPKVLVQKLKLYGCAKPLERSLKLHFGPLHTFATEGIRPSSVIKARLAVPFHSL